MNSPDLVVVSGAGSGIGRAVSHRLVAAGFHVLAAGRRPEGTPEEVASLISWLLGPDGGWVTGQVLSPNGGVVPGR